jgi:hypothetical protein
LSDVNKPSFPSGAGGVWFGPALAVLVAALLIWKPFGAGPEEEELLAAGPRLAGTLELSPSGRLMVHLDPLNEDPRRQAFDKVALLRRLELPKGEPWRLRLEAEGEAPGSPPADVQILDSVGACLAPILDGATPRAGAVEDPLFGIFRPHELAGEVSGWELVLWGRPPGPGGRLECSWGSADLVEGSAEEDLPGSVVHTKQAAAESRK